jgi:hypothetical protein
MHSILHLALGAAHGPGKSCLLIAACSDCTAPLAAAAAAAPIDVRAGDNDDDFLDDGDGDGGGNERRSESLRGDDEALSTATRERFLGGIVLLLLRRT